MLSSDQTYAEFARERKRIIVRIWKPILQKLKQGDEEHEITLMMGHISFEQGEEYRSLWQIEEKQQKSSAFFEEKLSKKEYKKFFGDLIEHYTDHLVSAPDGHKYARGEEPRSKFEYEKKLEGRDPDIVLCFHHIHYQSLWFKFSEFQKRIDYSPRLKHWIGDKRQEGLLIKLGNSGQCCPSATIDLLTDHKDTINLMKKTYENPYALPDDAGFDDLTKMLSKLKRSEIEKYPETEKFTYPGESPLDTLPKDEMKQCIIL